MNKDLKFLASVLDETNWPEDATTVRLDIDGEVCFNETTDHDFYPDDLDAAKDAFVRACCYARIGEEYSLQDILDARDELGLNNKKKSYTVDEVIDDLDIRQEVNEAAVALGFRQWCGPEDGLPPVETTCEMIHPGIEKYGWQKVTIKAYFDNKVVIEGSSQIWPDGFAITNIDQELKFRIIRSGEDKAVEEMLEVCKQGSFSYPTSEEMMRRLYRAGYRKQGNLE